MDFVRFERRGHVGIVTLDRPPVNAVNRQMYDEVKRQFELIDADQDVWVVILTGAGERAFVAGNDVNEFAAMTRETSPELMRHARASFWAVYDCRVPVIAAVNGPALGTGLAYAASCDLVVASERAVFGLPEIDVGVMGGAKHLSRMVPQFMVRKMFYTALRVPARELEPFGCFLAVVPPDQLMGEALRWAEIIASKIPVSIPMAKRSLNTIEYLDLKRGYEFEQSLTNELAGREEARAAARAFFERRKS